MGGQTGPCATSSSGGSSARRLSQLFDGVPASNILRDRLIYTAHVEHGYGFTEIASYLGLDEKTRQQSRPPGSTAACTIHGLTPAPQGPPAAVTIHNQTPEGITPKAR